MSAHPHIPTLSGHLRKIICAVLLFFSFVIGICILSLWSNYTAQNKLIESQRQVNHTIGTITDLLNETLENYAIKTQTLAHLTEQQEAIRNTRQRIFYELNQIKPVFESNLPAYRNVTHALNAFFIASSENSQTDNNIWQNRQMVLQAHINVMQSIQSLATQVATFNYEQAQAIKNRTENTTLALLALLLLGVATVFAGVSWWSQIYIKRPFARIGQLFTYAQQKNYPKVDLTSEKTHEIKGVLEILQHYISSSSLADELAQDLAAQAVSRAEAARLSQLGRSLPGVIFKMRYARDGSLTFPLLSERAEHFFKGVSPFFDPYFQKIDSIEMRNGHTPIPLALTNGIVSALSQTKEGTIDFNCRIDSHAETRWVRTLASVKLQDNGDTTVYGIWLDATDMLHQAEMLYDEKTSAENSAREKASFLAMMSHEIRTPLNGILGMTQVVLKGQLNTQERERVETIYRSGEHLLNIVNDVLDFSKMESNELTLEHIDFSMQRMLSDVGDLMAAGAAQKNLEFWIQVNQDVPDDIVGDPYRIRQVLLNFISNAIKFTPAGEVSVHVKTLKRTRSQVLLRFEVRDTGIGISAEQQSQLFQAFKQTDASISRRFGGTGLGLAISRRIAQLLQGETGMQSAAEQGSLFWFTAWVDMVGQSAAQRVRSSVSAKTEKFKNARILVAESHKNARATLLDILKELLPNAFIDIAITGQQTQNLLEKARQSSSPYDIAFISSYLPDMGGLTVVKKLQQTSQAPFAKTLWLVIPADDVELLSQAEQCHFTGAISKPLTRLRVYSALTKPQPLTLSGSSMHAAQGQTPALSDAATAWAPTGQNPLQRPHVLVVDDNELNRLIAMELLQSGSVEVDTASNGQMALDILAQKPPEHYSAILMDMQMPVMDGYCATRHIRSQAQFDDIPIIALTAHITNDETALAKSSGIDDFIAKPLIEALMWETLQKWHITPLQAPPPTYQAPPQSPGAQPATSTEAAAPAALAAPAATPAPTLPAAFDPAYWDDLCLSLPAQKVYDLSTRFMELSQQRIKTIAQACERADWDTARKTIHDLGGSTGTFGLVGAGEITYQMESLIKAGDPLAAQAQLAALEQVLSQGLTELSQRQQALAV